MNKTRTENKKIRKCIIYNGKEFHANSKTIKIRLIVEIIRSLYHQKKFKKLIFIVEVCWQLAKLNVVSKIKDQGGLI